MSSATDSSTFPPRIYLLLENTHKANNLGTVLRCVAAFGVEQVVAVGCNKCSSGSHGAAKHVSRVSFPGVEQAVAYLHDECNCKSLVGILGGVANAHDANGYSVVEENDVFNVVVTKETIDQSTAKRSYPIHSRPFCDGKNCFVIGKRPKGLPTSLASQCDFFVHVPHVNVMNDDNHHLLDTPSCLSIVLHHFLQLGQNTMNETFRAANMKCHD